MRNSQLTEVLKLSIAERIQLAEDIWDSLKDFPESLELTEDQEKELENRLENYRSNPSEGLSWDELKKQIKASK